MILDELRLLAECRVVVFIGLPATGKSLLVHELARIASEAGREVSLLQWDVARPAFDAHALASRYPMAASITHPVVRRAAGLWARAEIAAWTKAAGPDSMLIAEAPLVGWRFVEVVQQRDDATESVLAAASCRFVLPVPSNGLQAHLTEERKRRAAAPANAGEREEAPPAVLDAMWRLCVEAGRAMELTSGRPPTYDALLYRRVYERLARHRRLRVLAIDEVLKAPLSAYEHGDDVSPLLPEGAAIERFLALAESEASEGQEDEWLARWWEV
jgi:hypothetical protein